MSYELGVRATVGAGGATAEPGTSAGREREESEGHIAKHLGDPPSA